MNIREAVYKWVDGMDAIQEGMIERLMEYEPEDWHEVTIPQKGDSVYVYGTDGGYGTIESYNDETEAYIIGFPEGDQAEVEREDFSAEYDGSLPMWSTMWSFNDSADDWWLENGDGIEALSKCGFRVFESEQFGYFFGIDGAGYSFYEAHWEPLYKARGLKWHDEEEEEK